MTRIPAVRAALCGALTFTLGAVGCDGEPTDGNSGPEVSSNPDAGGAQVYAGTLPITNRSYRLLRGRGEKQGAALQAAEFFAELGAADAVCLGEIHDNDDHHAAQLLALERLLAQAAVGNGRIALGMEMFQKPFQNVLDQYAAGQIDERTLLAQTQWRQRWGFDFAYYRPLVEGARQAGAPLLALNAAQELTSKVTADKGLDALTADERAELPELDLSNAEHRAWFREAIGGYAPTSTQEFERRYIVQVIRDETMAELSWRWLQAQAPDRRQIAIVAGTGHCMDLAIPARLRRRGAGNVLSVKCVPEENAAAVQKAVAESYSDYVVVYAGGR
jgi:uncharacterized iron-regulated protein